MIGLPPDTQFVIDRLKTHGFEAYAVGGSVRDTILNRPTHGWDFTTNATPKQILEVFPDSFYDNQFGTVGIKIYQGNNVAGLARPIDVEEKPIDIFEITTYRSEQGYTDNRHPDTISWGHSLEEDLSRRDFTINAIAYDGTQFIDPYHGQEDLQQKLIRTVGDPHGRFSEDALRIMRAVRIATELGFFIEPTTITAITDHVASLSSVSAERIRDELLKLLKSPYASDGILLLKSTGILTLIIPELHDAFQIQQKSPKRHHIYDVGTHSVMALKHCPSTDPITRLAVLLHDIGKPETFRQDETGLITFYNHEVVGARLAKQIGYRLRLSKKQIDKLYTLVRWHQFTVDEHQTDSALRRFIRHVTKEYLDDMLDLRTGDRLGGGALETSWRLELFKKRLEDVQLQPFGINDLKVNGFDVMQTLNVQPGPVIGKTLASLFQAVDEGTLVNEKEALIAYIKTLPQ